MNAHKSAILQTHIAVILFSITAILGKLISLSALPLVWWRVLLASISFIFLFNVPKVIRTYSKEKLVKFGFIGIIIALHWLTFYGSIKLANASIALVCLACTSFLTSILEPLLTNKKVDLKEIVIGLIIIPAMMFIIKFTPDAYFIGIIVGLTSAFLASIFTILNKINIANNDARHVSFIELSAATIFLGLLLPIVFFYDNAIEIIPSKALDVVYLVALAFLCTTLAFLLSLRALKKISAFTSTLIINLEPVYGILLAAYFLNEKETLNIQFYLGASLIILAVILTPLFKNKNIESNR